MKLQDQNSKNLLINNIMKNWLKVSGILLATGIAFGAFGAHSLKYILNEEQLEIWNKGVLYHLIHGIGLLFIYLIAKTHPETNFKLCFYLLLMGVFLFSGSLYTISTNNSILGGTELLKNIMIPITPIGGICFISGWLLLAFKLK